MISASSRIADRHKRSRPLARRRAGGLVIAALFPHCHRIQETGNVSLPRFRGMIEEIDIFHEGGKKIAKTPQTFTREFNIEAVRVIEADGKLVAQAVRRSGQPLLRSRRNDVVWHEDAPLCESACSDSRQWQAHADCHNSPDILSIHARNTFPSSRSMFRSK